MKILALIPARGGSKGVKRKNIKPLNGIPLIAYTLKTALESGVFSKILVSTEDKEIAKFCKQFDLEPPFLRPQKLAEDSSPTIDTMLHALAYLDEIGENYDAICLLQPTVPFRSVIDLRNATLEFKRTKAESLISVASIPHQFNPNWAFVKNQNEDFLTLANGESQIISRRQDLPNAYYRDGSIYITKTAVLREKKSLYGDTIASYENRATPNINIDTIDDWQKAEQYIAEHGS